MARLSHSLLLLVLSLSLTALAVVNEKTCPLLGPVYPVPQKIDMAAFQSYTQNFTTALEAALSTGENSYGQWDNATTSFSISIWSVISNESLYERHVEGSQLNGSVTSGTLGNDTMYRIGSISKLLTVYTYLAAVGDKHLDEPVTQFIPELAAIDEATSKNSSANPIDNYRWSDITLRSLASQLSGLSRDYGLGDVAGLTTDSSLLQSWGLPPLDTIQVPLCTPYEGLKGPCTREQFFKGISTRRPVSAPYTTPSYSNPAFGLLAYALEIILNQEPFAQIMQEELLDPLALTRTLYNLPVNSTLPSKVIIPFNLTASSFTDDGGEDNPAGGYYSTLKDMNSLGRSILRSTLLPPSLTNHWLKPLTFTSDPNQGVGMPWEIYRTAIPVTPNSPATRLVDLYTKAGDIGLYHSLLALDRDHGMGFTVLVAGPGENQRLLLAEMLRDTFVPAFEDLAARAATAAYAGVYADPTTNSSITIATAPDRPGLGIAAWTSRGVNMTGEGFPAIWQSDPADRFEFRLQPTGLVDEAARRVGFRMVAEDRTAGEGSLWECFNWAEVDAVQYGGVGIDDFMFELDREGVASSLEPRAFRTKMVRQ